MNGRDTKKLCLSLAVLPYIYVQISNATESVI